MVLYKVQTEVGGQTVPLSFLTCSFISKTKIVTPAFTTSQPERKKERGGREEGRKKGRRLQSSREDKIHE